MLQAVWWTAAGLIAAEGGGGSWQHGTQPGKLHSCICCALSKCAAAVEEFWAQLAGLNPWEGWQDGAAAEVAAEAHAAEAQQVYVVSQ